MELIQRYFPEFTSEQMRQFAELHRLVLFWNERVNLVSRPDAENLEERHLLSSLAIAKNLRFPKGSRVMDVGTGGGFPGLPLAIAFPDCHYLLVDSVGKKIEAVNDMAMQLGLEHVETAHSRVETIHRKFDFVTGRAVKALPLFLSWVIPHLKPGSEAGIAKGVVYLKGGDLSEEYESIGVRPRSEQAISQYYPDLAFFESKSVLHFPADDLFHSRLGKQVMRALKARR